MTVVEVPENTGWRTERLVPGLRFMKRTAPGWEFEMNAPQVSILQQRWEITESKVGQFGGVDVRFEWRDVPLEEE